MATKEIKKRELVCPHTDCSYYSADQVQVEGEWILISYCSNSNADLIEKGTACRLYHLNWQKQMQKNGNGLPNGKNGVDLIRRRRTAILKMLRWTVNQLDVEDRETVFELVNELQQQEEESIKQKKHAELKSGEPLAESVDSGPQIGPDEGRIESTSELDEFSIVEQSLLNHRISSTQEEPPAKPEKDPNAPESVVERFIDCWNNQDFETEYELLSKRLQVVPKLEYVLSRQHAFADAMKNQNDGKIAKQNFDELIAVKTDGDFTYVECVKTEQAGRFEKAYQQSYSLLRENGFWRISKVRTTPVPKMKRRT